MQDLLERVGSAFGIGGRFLSARRLGSGWIHETWLASWQQPSGERSWVHQRINTEVFPAPERVMENLLRVTRHLRGRLDAAATPDAARRCLEVLPTSAGGLLHHEPGGGCWRSFPYIAGTQSFDEVASPEQARAAARAFGAFAAALGDLDADSLHVTLPHFHDMTRRLEAFEASVRQDGCGRAGAAQDAIEDTRRSAERLAGELPESVVAALPRRVVHHDCKLNNLLFDASSGEALCVVDLDTVMAGTLLSDFGELVRSAACRAPEDETDLSRVRLETPLFRALAEGYLAGTGSLCDAAERAALPCSGPRMALMNAVRFLTDHLEGDIYFRVLREGHNLDRARAQLRLAQDMLDQLPNARKIVEEA